MQSLRRRQQVRDLRLHLRGRPRLAGTDAGGLTRTEDAALLLHHLLRDHANEDEGSRPSAINLVSYTAENEFYDGAFMALTAFLRSAQKDIPSIRFSYTHFDGDRPGSDVIAAALREPRIGCHVKADGRILSGNLSPIRQLVGERERLAELSSHQGKKGSGGGATAPAEQILIAVRIDVT